MKHKKIFITIVLSLCLLVGAIGFTACNNGDENSGGGTPIKLTPDMSAEEIIEILNTTNSITVIREETVTATNNNTGETETSWDSNVAKSFDENVSLIAIGQDGEIYKMIDYFELSGDTIYYYVYLFSEDGESGSTFKKSNIYKSLKQNTDNPALIVSDRAKEMLSWINKTDEGWKLTDEAIAKQNFKNPNITFRNGDLIISDDETRVNNETTIVTHCEYKLTDINSTVVSMPDELNDINKSDATWSYTVSYKGVSYTLNNIGNLDKNGTAYSVSYCDESATSIILEETINTLPVNELGGGGVSIFYNCINLTTITIPASIEKIGSNIFRGCTALTTINCKAASKPSGWADDWLGDCTATVNWGV